MIVKQTMIILLIMIMRPGANPDGLSGRGGGPE